MLLTTTAVFAVLFVGSLAYIATADTSSEVASQTTQAGQREGGPGGGRAGQDITSFFDETGAVDQTAVDAMLERISQGGPEGTDSSAFLERFSTQIDASVEAGDITAEQGDALKAAFGASEDTET